MNTLSAAEVETRLKALDGWTLAGNAIQRQYRFDSFLDAIAFVDRLAPEAQAADHHPDILVSYTRVTLTYSTHSAGGLTIKDFEGATTADRIARCG